MSPRAADTGHGRDDPRGFVSRLMRAAVLGVTLLFVLAALAVSSALVIYTAWLHHLREGAFALLFAVLSAQIALNWLLWRDDDED
ncbi:MAG: hypothetical protein ACR2HO_06475 [Rubrobacteraceae bacterium]|jgi:hypothetical protein|nr:hypothetical protein [Rubrobacter sp.]